MHSSDSGVDIYEQLVRKEAQQARRASSKSKTSVRVHGGGTSPPLLYPQSISYRTWINQWGMQLNSTSTSMSTSVWCNVQCALFGCMFCMADAKMKLLKNTWSQRHMAYAQYLLYNSCCCGNKSLSFKWVSTVVVAAVFLLHFLPFNLLIWKMALAIEA